MPEPEAKPRLAGKLPPAAQDMLRSFRGARPEVEFPPHLALLGGTHGFYYGDGEATHSVKIGWRPAFVLFTLPVFQGLLPGEPVYDPAASQPPLTDDGFRAPAMFNRLGELVMFVVWRSEGDAKAPKPGGASEATS
ncbi:hypothetical protein HY251_00535 [bacterium]|nr:hypothetical protein [bacterium]